MATAASALWGVIDKTGAFVVQPKYDYMGPFSEGLASFRMRESEKARYGFLDRKGVEVIPPIFHQARHFSEGLAAGKVADLWGYVLSSGVFKITPRFEGSREGTRRQEKTKAGFFVDGLSPTWSGKGYGFIDATGEFVIRPEFDEANSFRECGALIQRQKRFGFVDREGRTVIQPEFAFANDFSEGLAVVRNKNNRSGYIAPCGFIDVNGEMIIRPQFHNAKGFRHGLSFVNTENHIGYINTAGEYVWQGPYVECRTE